ncbi:U6 snRNA-associated Sm-like protein LSm1 [Convolutriloba macropyga]|uniref:U6 snRNA-associated Sm-like protein LSm1 n=1 Tax=Convolutriloba macropyga TaxID=536237 RepID=UPI003F51BE0B
MESQYPQCIVDGQPYLPGCISILSYLEKRLMVVLRDGKTFIGYLQSIDQFANLLLSKTKERIYVGSKFGDIERGIYIVRGENVVLIGEVDPVKEEQLCAEHQMKTDEILIMQKQQQLLKIEAEKARQKFLKERGLDFSAALQTFDDFS